MTTSPPVIEQLPLDQLTPYEDNARCHPPEQIQQLADAIQRLGFLNPILIDSAGVIIAGHGRYEAARRIGLSKVPVVRLSGLTDEQARCMRIEDNALAAASRWDMSAMLAEVDRLSASADSVLAGLLSTFDPGDPFAGIEPPTAKTPPSRDLDDADDDEDDATADTEPSERATGPTYEAHRTDSGAELISPPPAGSLACDPDFSRADSLHSLADSAELTEDERAFLRRAAALHVFFQIAPALSSFPAALRPMLQRCFVPSLIGGHSDA